MKAPNRSQEWKDALCHDSETNREIRTITNDIRNTYRILESYFARKANDALSDRLVALGLKTTFGMSNCIACSKTPSYLQSPGTQSCHFSSYCFTGPPCTVTFTRRVVYERTYRTYSRGWDTEAENYTP